jgi:hypothetical protein
MQGIASLLCCSNAPICPLPLPIIAIALSMSLFDPSIHPFTPKCSSTCAPEDGISHQGFSLKTIQAYLGYYCTSLRNCAPLPQAQYMQGISSQDVCYLAVRCLPLNISNRYFILREWVHQLQRPGAGQYRSRVSWKSIVWTQAGGQGSKAVGVAC